MTQLLDAMGDADRRLIHFVEARRQLALAEAGLGNLAEAGRILDALLAEHGHENNRLVVGLLHQAKAEAALLGSDAKTFERHVREMEQRFRSTRNPALVAQCERMLDRAAQLGLDRLDPLDLEDADTVQEFSAMLSGTGELGEATDPCARALTVLQARTGAKSGYLYLRQEGALKLAASSDANGPPRLVEEALNELADGPPRELDSAEQGTGTGTEPVSSAHSTTANPSTTGSSLVTGEASSSLSSQASDDGEIDETQMVSDEPVAQTLFQRSDRPPNPLDFYKLLLLEAREGESRVVVGGLILEARARQVARVSSELLQGIAQVLHDRLRTTSLEHHGRESHPG
jgi:hypothetical protein